MGYGSPERNLWWDGSEGRGEYIITQGGGKENFHVTTNRPRVIDGTLYYSH